MKKIQQLIKFITDPQYRFYLLSRYGLFNHWPDEKFLKRKFKSVFGYDLDLQNPQTYNEKLQWLKLHDRNPLYTTLVDKYAVKKWVADKIGAQYIIPTLGVWKSFDEIDFNKLPNQFVLKTTHNSGGIAICTDKRTFNKQAARKKLTNSLKHNYYLHGREWPYKNARGQIIAEPYLEDAQSGELRDYKFFCFHGEVPFSMVCRERFSKTGLKITFYDKDWNVLPVKRKYPIGQPVSCPPSHALMQQLAAKLAKDIPFVRVDFYEVNGQVYFGEMTFYPGSGFEKFEPHAWDKKIGDLLTLPTKKD